MHNTFNLTIVYLHRNHHLGYRRIIMKKTTALSFSSLLLLGGVSYLAAKLADLDLTFFFDGDDDQHHYC